MFHQSSKQISLGIFVALLLIAVPVYAVKDFKVSNYAGGHQIWFEAEHFDELDPSDFCSIVDEPGAFGQALNPGGGNGIARWTFDISTAGGKAGTWYFWGRVINPSNMSDFMLVEGHPGDPVIPTEPPYPGNKNPIFDDTMDRIFEQDVGPPWGWAPGTAEAHEEGHTKELRDGSNTMCIYDRQANSTVFWDVFMWTDNPDYVPTDEDYLNARIFVPGPASNPSPPHEATDVLREVVLSWTPGAYAAPTNGQKVYFSESFEDVNAGVGGITQSANSYTPPQRLDFGTTYYWRVDEVNNVNPDSPWIGKVWNFTTEPIGYHIENITATASSSQQETIGPGKTIDGSGLDDNDLHSVEQTDMWLSGVEPQGAWIEYEFDKLYKLHELWVWNSNQVIDPVIGFGFKDVTIEYSTNGTDYTTLGTTHQFAQSPGTPDYAHNTTVDLGGVVAKYIRLTANSNWGGIMSQYGLSEVRFFYIPVRATEPSPDSGATDVDVDVTLGFRAGREAAQHDVYLSTDEQAVIDGTAAVISVPETSYGPLSLDLAQTYYWKINEVNMAETPTTLEGDVWNLTTRQFLVVDDFESYNDLDPDDPESNRIFNAWIDGYEQPTNGSVVGYASPPFAEQSIVHSGGQSMPLFYDNTGTARYSEAELTLTPAQDWTKNGITALSLWFSGDPNNVPDQMYVKINGSKIAYDGDASNLTRVPWQPWNIDLASAGMDLQNVTKFSIGFGDETSMMPGGSGVVYFDDIKLYPYSRQLATPADPGPANLAAHYEFEGTANDSSGNGLHGTVMGNPTFVAGKVGQAISLDGMSDYVNITGYKGILGPSAVTVTAWVNTTTTGTGTIVGWGPNVAGQRFGFRINDDRTRMEHQGGNVQGDSNVNDGQWHHVAVTVQASATISYPDVILYVDGIDDTRATTDSDAFNLTAGQDVRIGSRPSNDDRFFIGSIDDVRIYDRALTEEEIAWLAGRTKPFDKPF